MTERTIGDSVYIEVLMPKTITKANNVNIDLTTEYNVSGSIETFLYDKYRENEPITLSPNYTGGIARKVAAKGYMPFVEEGKTWKYLYHNYAILEDKSEDLDAMMRIEGSRTIDGELYHILNLYYGPKGQMDFIATLGYLKEDVSKKTVWFMADENLDHTKLKVAHDVYENTQEPILMYDFTTGQWLDVVPDEGDEVVEHSFEALDGSIRRATYIDSNPLYTYMLTEGLGLMDRCSNSNDDATRGFCGDILGETPMPTGLFTKEYYIPILREIVAGDGTKLYVSNILDTDGLETATEGRTEITHMGTTVTVSKASGSLGSVTVTDASGVRVRDFNANGSTFTFSVDGYMPGIYIIQAEGMTKKIVVK